MAKKRIRRRICSNCREKIIPGMQLVMNKRTICLGCAVEKGIAQQLNASVMHHMNCSGDAQTCAECFLDHRDMMLHLGYIYTDFGTFYKRTNDPKIVVLYE
jgi:hypothetical protein